MVRPAMVVATRSVVPVGPVTVPVAVPVLPCTLVVVPASTAAASAAATATLVMVVMVMVSAVGRGRLLRWRLLAVVLLLLSLLVVHEVVEDRRRMPVRVHDSQHLQSLGMGHFLRVAGIRHRLVVVVLQADVTQLHVGHVLHVNPTDLRHHNPHVGLTVDVRLKY